MSYQLSGHTVNQLPNSQEEMENLQYHIQNFQPVPFDLGQALVHGFSEHEQDIAYLNSMKIKLAELLGTKNITIPNEESRNWEIYQKQYEDQ